MKTTLTVSIPYRFRELREKANLSIEQAAERMGIDTATLWDIETYDDDLVNCCSLREVQRFAGILGVTAYDLLSTGTNRTPVTASELAALIQQYCSDNSIGLAEFEDIVGWELVDSLATPIKLLDVLHIQGLIDICEQIDVDWLRVVRSL